MTVKSKSKLRAMLRTVVESGSDFVFFNEDALKRIAVDTLKVGTGILVVGMIAHVKQTASLTGQDLMNLGIGTMAVAPVSLIALKAILRKRYHS